MKPYPSKPFAFLWYYLRQSRWLVFAAFSCIGLIVLSSKLEAYYFSKIIDKMGTFAGYSADIWQKMMPLLVILFFINFAGGIIRRIMAFFAVRFEPQMCVRIKQDATAYILNHATQFLINQPAGKLAERVSQLAGHANNFFWTLLYGFFRPTMDLIITIVMLAMINFYFAISFLFWMIVLGIFVVISSTKNQKIAKKCADKDAEATGIIVDSISNSLVVKSFGNISFENKKISTQLQEVLTLDKSFLSKLENTNLAQTIIVGLFDFSMIVISLFLWSKGVITTGQIVLVLLLINTVMRNFHLLLRDIMGLHRTLGVMSSALKVVSEPHQMKDATDAAPLKVRKGKIEFRNVFFAYGEKPLFKNFSLTIQPGERVGLVGVSGSGKTTFVNLLQRFFDVDEGSVLIDGQDVRSVSQESLHKNIAVVPQDTALFNRSLKENIAYGKVNATDRQIKNAALKAFADDFIMQTPGGYNSLVGDKGVKLSGGQRQRIAIARAFLKNAPILVLDEATSALDSQSEYFIQKSIKELMKGKTTIAIAHRLSTLKEMDRIIVMKKGKIIEQGSPSALLKKKGTYARLWQMQTKAVQVEEPEEKKYIKAPVG